MFEFLKTFEGNVQTASYSESFMLMANPDPEFRCSGRGLGTH
jgi:hypothetical protein